MLPWERRGGGGGAGRRTEKTRGEDVLRLLLEARGVFPPHSYMPLCVLTCSKPLCNFLQCISLHFIPVFMYMQ